MNKKFLFLAMISVFSSMQMIPAATHTHDEYAWALELITPERQDQLNQKFIETIENNQLKEVEEFLKVIGDDNVAKVTKAIAEGGSANKRISFCRSKPTVLMYAASKGFANVVQVLINAGADVNAVDDDYVTALLTATVNGEIDIVKQLIKAGANPDIANYQGFTPVMAAALKGDPSIMFEFFSVPMDVNKQQEDGYTALMFAVDRRDGVTARLLLKKDANPFLKDHKGNTIFNHPNVNHVYIRDAIIGERDKWSHWLQDEVTMTELLTFLNHATI